MSTSQMSTVAVEGFESTTFSALGEERVVYRRGAGPPVLIMHEVPGITPPVAHFARRVADDGFSVTLPQLFGIPNDPKTPVNSTTVIARACISKEFSVLARRGSSPITKWLRALSRSLHQTHGGAGVGAIGMCLTGNFALSLMVDPWLMAPVLSQPALPFGVTASHRAALHVSTGDLATIRRRACDEGASVLGMRFTHDWMVPEERFDTLRRELGDGFEAIEIDSGPGNKHGIHRLSHSVVTQHLVDEEGHPTRAALERVLSFFHEKLDGGVPDQ